MAVLSRCGNIFSQIIKYFHGLKYFPAQPSSPPGSALLLTSRHQEAVLALGIFYLESGFLHEEKILDYLLSVTSSLATATFPDEIPSDRRAKLPPAEIFSFNLVTLLNDIARNNPATAERILETQLELLSSIYSQLQAMMKQGLGTGFCPGGICLRLCAHKQDKPAAFNSRRWTCKVTKYFHKNISTYFHINFFPGLGARLAWPGASHGPVLSTWGRVPDIQDIPSFSEHQEGSSVRARGVSAVLGQDEGIH